MIDKLIKADCVHCLGVNLRETDLRKKIMNKKSLVDKSIVHWLSKISEKIMVENTSGSWVYYLN